MVNGWQLWSAASRGIGILGLALLLGAAGCRSGATSGDAFPQPVVGSSGRFQEYPRWNVSGQVVVVDPTTLRFEDFTFHGDNLTARVLLNRDQQTAAFLMDLTGRTYDRATFNVPLPDGIQVDDFNLVMIFAPELGTAASSVRFD